MLLVPWTMFYVDFCDYVYAFFAWSKHYNMSLCLAIGYIPIMSELLLVWMLVVNLGPTVWGNPAAHYCVERRNLLVVTHPSKTDRHQPYGTRHPAQQQADYEQGLRILLWAVYTWHWSMPGSHAHTSPDIWTRIRTRHTMTNRHEKENSRHHKLKMLMNPPQAIPTKTRLDETGFSQKQIQNLILCWLTCAHWRKQDGGMGCTLC